MNNLASNLAWALAATFLAAAVIGFVPNPLVGPDSLFVTNTPHNLVHLVTAFALAGVAAWGQVPSIRFMQVFGVVYLLTGVFGFLTLGSASQGYLLGVVHINQLDNFLHIGLGLVISAAGWVAARQVARVVTAG